MDLKQQKKELYEHLRKELHLDNYSPNIKHWMRKAVKAILRRYDVFPVMDLKQQEEEMLEYLEKEIGKKGKVTGNIFYGCGAELVKKIVQAILRRYDVFPVEDERRE